MFSIEPLGMCHPIAHQTTLVTALDAFTCSCSITRLCRAAQVSEPAGFSVPIKTWRVSCGVASVSWDRACADKEDGGDTDKVFLMIAEGTFFVLSRLAVTNHVRMLQ